MTFIIMFYVFCYIQLIFQLAYPIKTEDWEYLHEVRTYKMVLRNLKDIIKADMIGMILFLPQVVLLFIFLKNMWKSVFDLPKVIILEKIDIVIYKIGENYYFNNKVVSLNELIRIPILKEFKEIIINYK